MKIIRTLFILLLLTVIAVFALPVFAQTVKPLPQTYVSDDERLTLRYPAGWVLKSDSPDQVFVATDASLFDIDDETVPPGQAAFGLVLLEGDFDLASALGVEDDPLWILNAFTKSLFTSGDEVTLSPPESLNFADHPAARVDGTYAGSDLFLMIVDQGDKHYALYIAYTAAGEMPKFEPKLLAIGESVHYLISDSE
jgi:hypothetical protein